MNSQSWLYQLRVNDRFTFDGNEYRLVVQKFDSVANGQYNIENVATGDRRYILWDTKVVPLETYYENRTPFENCRPNKTSRGRGSGAKWTK